MTRLDPQTGIPRPEYPRPQLRRENWLCLNGLWDFAFDFSRSGIEKGFVDGGVYPHKILVPFCPESSLSGVGCTDFIPAVWYRRSFTLTASQCSGRVLLHFGAVDHDCQVWVNGRPAGRHIGGYTSFTFDITALARIGQNTVTVYAEDDVRSPWQPSGKQSEQYASYGCYYTRTTGIWQTVWLEFTPHAYIAGLRITPDAHNASVTLEAMLVDGAGANLSVTLLEEGRPVWTGRVRCTETCARCTAQLSDPRLWSPDSPFLYDVTLQLEQNGAVDTVRSYFGLRTVEWHDHAFYLNGRPLFQRLVLDQGFYPDGIYTAPTDQALIQDIQLAQALGFNGARLHQKVFEERYLYHADRLGYLVWGEYGSWGLDVSHPRALEIFLPPWLEELQRDYSHPALIGWCPFNETFDVPFEHPRRAQDDEVLRDIYLLTKALDPTRPVIDTSGFYHVITDLYDLHDYEQDPAVFRRRYAALQPGEPDCYDEKRPRQHYNGSQPLFMSEYGGTYWSPDPARMDAWQPDAGWLRWPKPRSEEEVCARITGLTAVLLESPAFCGFCYTQLTDVEQEFNGLYQYDRSKKFSDAVYDRIRAAIAAPAAIEQA